MQTASFLVHVHRETFNQKASMTFWQVSSVASCVRSSFWYMELRIFGHPHSNNRQNRLNFYDLIFDPGPHLVYASVKITTRGTDVFYLFLGFCTQWQDGFDKNPYPSFVRQVPSEGKLRKNLNTYKHDIENLFFQ